MALNFTVLLRDRAGVGARFGRGRLPIDGSNYKDTNMEFVGSAMDVGARQKAAQTDPAWQGVGLEPGLWIWRIENFLAKPWPREQYGQFCDADSYICMYCLPQENGGEGGDLERRIHYWLGKRTRTDEKGTAAFRSMDLDALFGGDPVHYREVQGEESDMFKSYFEKDIVYFAGGVGSGLKSTAKDVLILRLFQVRLNSQRNIIVELEPKVAWQQLNHRDAFILDAGRKVYIFKGDSSSIKLQEAADAKAQAMEDERNGLCEVVTELDDHFWNYLGGPPCEITPADQVPFEADWDEGQEVLADEDAEDVLTAARSRLAWKLRVPNSTPDMGMRKSFEEPELTPEAAMFTAWIKKKASAAEGRIAMSTAANVQRCGARSKVLERPEVAMQAFKR